MRVVLVGLLCVAAVRGQDDPDAAAVKAAGLSTDAPALLDFVKQRSRENAPADELAPLLKDLADAKAAPKASAALIARGPLAVPSLRRLANDPADKAVAERAKKALAQVEGRAGAHLAACVVRLVGSAKLDGGVEALLAYLPYVDDATVADAASEALAKLAYPNGKAHPALVAALDHDKPIHRGAAVEALSQPDHPETRPLVAKRLADTAAVVRKRAALALAKVEDLSAIPVLIELVGELAKPDRAAVDDMLRGFALETGPKTDADRDAWAKWWKEMDGPRLLSEFTTRTLAGDDQAKVTKAILELGHANYRVRERAGALLMGMGAKALADLRVAATDPDNERAERAAHCIATIYASDTKRVPMGAARLAGLRKPDGATAALLGYLPYADDDDGMIGEVKKALAALATKDGQPDAALTAALASPVAVRRAAAAEALALGGGDAARPGVKKMLADRDPVVRQAVGTALASVGDRDAVPVLIDLLADLPGAKAWPAQDVLYQLAADQSPSILAGDGPDDRRRYRDEWAAWWKAKGEGVDLTKALSNPGHLGYTLIMTVGNNSVGRVAELGRDGKTRWEIKNLKYPVDAFVLPGDRVLVTEWDGNRVGEWDFKGNLVWKKEGFQGRATNAQRLPNGNTFICTTSELLEVDRSGRTVYKVEVPKNLTAGYRAHNGELVCLRNDGMVVRYDTHGRELKAFPSLRDTSWTSGIDIMRGGNILVSQPTPNMKVVEYTPDGKSVREWSVTNVTTATKAANGHILAASHNDRNVVELDPSGKKVWEHKDQEHVFRARRR